MLYGSGSDCIFINKIFLKLFSGGVFFDIFSTGKADKLSYTGLGIGVESLQSDCY